MEDTGPAKTLIGLPYTEVDLEKKARITFRTLKTNSSVFALQTLQEYSEVATSDLPFSFRIFGPYPTNTKIYVSEVSTRKLDRHLRFS